MKHETFKDKLKKLPPSTKLVLAMLWSGGLSLAMLVGMILLTPKMSKSPPPEKAGLSAFQTHKNSVLILRSNGIQKGGGTGFTINTKSRGPLTVTNAHICDMAGEGNYLLAGNEFNGRIVPIRVIKIYKKHDLCIAEPVPGSPPLFLSTHDAEEGDSIVLLGHPFLRPLTPSEGVMVKKYDSIDLMEEDISSDKCYGPNLSMKRISIQGPFGGDISAEVCIRTVQANTISNATYPGNSGSPALNKDGKLIGVLFAGDNRTHQGCLVPLIDLEEFLQEAIGDIGEHR